QREESPNVVTQDPYIQELHKQLNSMCDGGVYDDKEMDISQLSVGRQGLLTSARACMKKYSDDKSKSSHWLQNSRIALTYTLDLGCPEATVPYFDSTFLDSARKACLDIWPQTLPATTYDLAGLAQCWDNHGGNLRPVEARLRRRLGRLASKTCQDESREILALMEIIAFEDRCTDIDEYEDEMNEARVMNFWVTLLKIFSRKTPVRLRRGEAFITSTRRSQEIAKTMLGDNFSSCYGIDDLLCISNKLDLANFDFKAPGNSKTVIEERRKRNLQLNRSILEALMESGFEAPALLYVDFEGKSTCYTGAIFALVKFQDIFVCQEVTKITYPRTVKDIRALLNDGYLLRALSTLTAFLSELGQSAQAAA
ncbi:hypothetical protein BGZ94_003445, partial [Podila epigama]